MKPDLDNLTFSDYNKYIIVDIGRPDVDLQNPDSIARFLSIINERYGYKIIHIADKWIFMEKNVATPGMGAQNVEAPAG